MTEIRVIYAVIAFEITSVKQISPPIAVIVGHVRVEGVVDCG